MDTYIANLANPLFYSSQKRLNASAKFFGINNIFSFKYEELLNTKFFSENKRILGQRKGLGYWLWKPYIILEVLKKANDGDILIYSDSGIEIIGDLSPLIKLVRTTEGVLVFNNCDYTNNIWTKRDCFVLMDCDNENYWFGPHIEGAFQVYQKNKFSLSFVEEWLNYGKNENIITDLPNVTGFNNIEGYREHRWDQSILSNLVIKHNLQIFRCPTQFGNHYKMPDFRINGELTMQNHFTFNYSYSDSPFLNSPYFTLLNHHRTKESVSILHKVIRKVKLFPNA